MNHIWKSNNPWGKPIEDTCERCRITRSSTLYSGLTGSMIGRIIRAQVNLDCDEMILKRVCYHD